MNLISDIPTYVEIAKDMLIIYLLLRRMFSK